MANARPGQPSARPAGVFDGTETPALHGSDTLMIRLLPSNVQ
jgi:hypothetical protein